ncbi:hypothetical protein SDC9_164626 [bioreactor metagenome]|uniref:Uncharacterized protein n=1 Tax=bioreactor metagenome TaxID=1076179 RepID=A0A645FZC3_9ZZZZ
MCPGYRDEAFAPGRKRQRLRAVQHLLAAGACLCQLRVGFPNGGGNHHHRLGGNLVGVMTGVGGDAAGAEPIQHRRILPVRARHAVAFLPEQLGDHRHPGPANSNEVVLFAHAFATFSARLMTASVPSPTELFRAASPIRARRSASASSGKTVEVTTA